MVTTHIRPRATIIGVPIHRLLVPFPIVCLTGALVTDVAYAATAQIQWANFSAWLLAIGTATAVLAAIAGLIDLSGRQPGPRPTIAWWHMGGNILVLLLATLNNIVHARDGWTSVVPLGLTLSAITVLLLMVTGLLGHLLSAHPVADQNYAGARR